MKNKINLSSEEKKLLDEELKKSIDRNERQSLLFATEALLPTKSLKKELEKHQLRNGLEFTLKEVNDLIREVAREYSPMFPNNKPFFKLMYRLCDWKNLNPNAFIKPPCVALYIKQYIYARFPKEVLPSLLAKDNPLISGYIKKYKLFQFLKDEGVLMLEEYIEDAIAIMEKSKDWYEFELKYSQQYQLSVQLKCFHN